MNQMNLDDPTSPGGDSDDNHEELVAYLDGEVTDSQRERIENRLSQDADYRNQWVELERTWRMLDRLPTCDHDREFTRTTIAMVKEEIAHPNVRKDALEKRRMGWIRLIAMGVACALGYFAVTFNMTRAEQKKLEDLSVARNMDLYRYIESVELLRLMRDEKTFDRSLRTVATTDASGKTQTDPANPSNAALQSSVRRFSSMNDINDLSDAEKTQLLELRSRFEKLPAVQANQMRAIHRQLINDPDTDGLFATLRDYREWLATLNAAERADLIDIKDPGNRLHEIKTLQREQAVAIAGSDVTNLTSGDKQAVLEFVRDYFRDNAPKILDQLPEDLQRRARSLRPSPFRDTMLWFVTFTASERFGNEQPIQAPLPSPESMQRLEARLSPEAKIKWQSATDLEQRKALLEKWIRVSLQGIRHTITTKDLESYYLNALTSSQRDELNQLPPEEMRETLRRWYSQNRSDFGPGRGPHKHWDPDRRRTPRGPFPQEPGNPRDRWDRKRPNPPLNRSTGEPPVASAPNQKQTKPSDSQERTDDADRRPHRGARNQHTPPSETPDPPHDPPGLGHDAP